VSGSGTEDEEAGSGEAAGERSSKGITSFMVTPFSRVSCGRHFTLIGLRWLDVQPPRGYIRQHRCPAPQPLRNQSPHTGHSRKLAASAGPPRPQNVLAADALERGCADQFRWRVCVRDRLILTRRREVLDSPQSQPCG